MTPKTITPEAIKAARAVRPVFSRGRLVALRQLDGRSQRQLADDVGFTASALSQIERGLTRPTVRNLALLAIELGVEPSAFVGRAEPTVAMQPQFRQRTNQ